MALHWLKEDAQALVSGVRNALGYRLVITTAVGALVVIAWCMVLLLSAMRYQLILTPKGLARWDRMQRAVEVCVPDVEHQTCSWEVLIQ